MNKNQFLQLITQIKEQDAKSDAFYKLGMDIINITETYNKTINLLLECQFGALGADIIYWFLFDSSPKVITYKGKKVKVDTAERLFDYLVKEGYLKS